MRLRVLVLLYLKYCSGQTNGRRCVVVLEVPLTENLLNYPLGRGAIRSSCLRFQRLRRLAVGALFFKWRMVRKVVPNELLLHVFRV